MNTRHDNCILSATMTLKRLLEVILDLLNKNTSLTSLQINNNIANYDEIQSILSEREPPIEGPMVKVAIPSIPRSET